jgi:hypothetical protein
MWKPRRDEVGLRDFAITVYSMLSLAFDESKNLLIIGISRRISGMSEEGKLHKH